MRGLLHPGFERVELLGESDDGSALLTGVAPVEIELLLDARTEQERSAGLGSDLSHGAVEQRGNALENVARCVRE
jgi:hypothetical protein